MKKFEELTQDQKDRIVKHHLERLEQEVENIKNREHLLLDPNQNKLAKELQKRLVQCCIDYIKETGNTDIWRVNFTADCLQESAKHGEWCPCTDSVCELENEYKIISFST